MAASTLLSIPNLKPQLCHDWWWCPKNHQWATWFSHAWNNTCTIKKEDLAKSTDVVPVKYPPKVKLELLTTLECQSWDELCIPIFWGSLGFYSSVELSSKTCDASLFLVENIFTNVHIVQNPPYIRILLILGLYGLGFIMKCKWFPFKVSWKSHYN